MQDREVYNSSHSDYFYDLQTIVWTCKFIFYVNTGPA